jgi:4-hydroxy-tetrahydrodipicolinate synthase
MGATFMAVRLALEGIYTPLISPLHADGRIDFDALASLIERLIVAGVHGLISGGSTGESYAQTVEERLEIARFTVARVAGRLPVFVGTGAMRTPDSVALAAGARAMGADGLLLGTPPYALPTEREKRGKRLGNRPRGGSADHPLQLPSPHGRRDGAGVSG